MQRNGGLDPAKLKQIGERQKLHDALRVLGDKELTYNAWKAEAKEHAGIGLNTFKLSAANSWKPSALPL